MVGTTVQHTRNSHNLGVRLQSTSKARQMQRILIRRAAPRRNPAGLMRLLAYALTSACSHTLTHTHALSFTRARTLARVYARLATLAWSAPTPFLPDHAVPSLTLPAVRSDGSCPPVSPCALPWFRCLAFPALLHRYECRRPQRRSRCSDRMYGACMSSFARAHHDDLRKALSPCVDQPFRSMQSEQLRLAVCVRCTWQARSMCGAPTISPRIRVRLFSRCVPSASLYGKCLWFVVCIVWRLRPISPLGPIRALARYVGSRISIPYAGNADRAEGGGAEGCP